MAEALVGISYRIDFPCGRLMITVNRNSSGTICQVMIRSGKQGSCSRTMHENMARLINLGLDNGIPIEDIVGQLNGHNCGNSTWHKGAQYLSCTDALSAILLDGGADGD